jgi:citrate synthase
VQGPPNHIQPRGDLGHAANYLYMLNGKESSSEVVRALNTYLVLLADHGMNVTFTARVIASTDSDLASCLVGAIGALKGPAHGGAPSAVMDQLEQIVTADNADHWLREARTRKVRFMGFGHRVYRSYDPRAKILKALCERLNPKFYELASKVEETALAILHEEHPERPQATNVEFYSAGVLQAIGLPKEYFPPTFAVSRGPAGRRTSWSRLRTTASSGRNRSTAGPNPENRYRSPSGDLRADRRRGPKEAWRRWSRVVPRHSGSNHRLLGVSADLSRPARQ